MSGWTTTVTKDVTRVELQERPDGWYAIYYSPDGTELKEAKLDITDMQALKDILKIYLTA